MVDAKDKQTVYEHLSLCHDCAYEVAAIAKFALNGPTAEEKLALQKFIEVDAEAELGRVMAKAEAFYSGHLVGETSQSHSNANQPFVTQPAAARPKSRLQSWWSRWGIAQPQYAFTFVILLFVMAGSWWGVRFYQNTYPIIRAQQELQTKHRLYVNVNDFVENAPWLSGKYTKQTVMLMAPGDEDSTYLETAQKQIDRVLQRDPKSVKAKQVLAQIFVIRQEYAKADSVLQSNAAEISDDPALLNDQGVLHFALNDLPAAAKDFVAAIKADPKLLEARYNLALVQAKLGMSAEARANLQRYVELETDEGLRRAAAEFQKQLNQSKE
ncbi:MAG: hypothetical protein ILNGONEN_00544 [Syntrophorhabdaceae bacterium]|nr:hypothetical protein [Syntrophorhabdaceae bacterium]